MLFIADAVVVVVGVVFVDVVVVVVVVVVIVGVAAAVVVVVVVVVRSPPCSMTVATAARFDPHSPNALLVAPHPSASSSSSLLLLLFLFVVAWATNKQILDGRIGDRTCRPPFTHSLPSGRKMINAFMQKKKNK